MSRRDLILSELKKGEELTSMKAFGWGETRLAAQVHALRARGHAIKTRLEKQRAGQPYAVYWI